MSPDKSDSELMFRQLLAREEPALRRMLRSYEHDEALRDELFQDVCLAIWRALRTFRGEASIRTFAYRIAHNRATSHVLRQRRRRETTADEPAKMGEGHPVDRDLGPAHALPHPGPHQRAVIRERQRQLQTAIRDLPIGLRQAVVLRLEGQSHAEIAEVLGISENASAIRLSRAAERLRRQVAIPAATRGESNS